MTADRDKPGDAPERYDFEKWVRENIEPIDPAVDAARQAERVRKIRAKRLEASTIDLAILPEEYEWVVNNEFPLQTFALKAVKRWEHVHGRQRFRPFSTMVLSGLRGRGKTVAGAWLIAQYDDTDVNLARGGAFYATCEELRQSRMTKERKVFERACSACVLVADELGTEDDDNDSHQRMLYELVNRRSGLSTAWTLFLSNFDRKVLGGEEVRGEHMPGRYDIRTIEKIEQRGMFVQIPDTEPNLRKRLEDELAKRNRGGQLP